MRFNFSVLVAALAAIHGVVAIPTLQSQQFELENQNKPGYAHSRIVKRNYWQKTVVRSALLYIVASVFVVMSQQNNIERQDKQIEELKDLAAEELESSDE